MSLKLALPPPPPSQPPVMAKSVGPWIDQEVLNPFSSTLPTALTIRLN